MKAVLSFTLLLLSFSTFASESTCYGTTSKGKLENGVKLPSKGKNFTNYSNTAILLGRTYVHSTVNEIVVESFKYLETEQPKKIYKYGETGFKNGGRFKPHKTHQNGLSIDFFVPVVDKNGKSVYLSTNALNKWGYSIEFNQAGKYGNLEIDYVALGAHIVALDKISRKKGYKLWRVIFDPKLQPFLLKTKYGEYIKKNIKLSTRRSWVRHDEHYHVDFSIKCKK